jgi:hypothetical protein
VRRLDLLPVGLVLALAGTVGAMAVRSSRLAVPLAAESHALDAPDAELTDSSDVTEISLAMRAGSAHVRSETRRSRLAPPDFDRNDVLRRLSFGASGTYVMAMLDADSGLTRWPDRPLEPIRVWIEPTSSLADWRPEYVDSAGSRCA